MILADAPYLEPYRNAARRHGSSFRSLLWASPFTQRARFDAITRAQNLDGQVILDAGCGRADLLDFLHDRGIFPGQYVGIEAVQTLIDRARAKHGNDACLIDADFVQTPDVLRVGADVIIFSGSLNTLDDDAFERTLRHAYDVAQIAVVLNFLCSPVLAARPFLHWRKPADVMNIARDFGARTCMIDDYLEGDCTLSLRKPGARA